MSENPTLRTNNTKVLIAEAYIALTERKPIDKITVKDVVETCGITRQTFYYHYQDLLDVIEWIVSRGIDDLIARTIAAKSQREAIGVIVSSCQERPEFLERLFNSRRRQEAERIFFDGIRRYFLEVLRRSPVAPRIRYASDLETALTFYSCAITGVLIENSFQRHLDPEVLTDQLLRLLKGELLPHDAVPDNEAH